MSAPATTGRWKATIFYRHDTAGLTEAEHQLQALAELDDIVARCPEGGTIAGITIQEAKRLTLEQRVRQ